MHHIQPTLAVRAILAIVAVAAPRAALGQAAWEITPYQVHASVVAHEFSPVEQARLKVRIAELAEAHLGGAWQFAITPASAGLHGEMQTRLSELTAESVFVLDPAAGPGDKRMLIVISAGDLGEVVSVRELDVATRQLGPVLVRRAARREDLAYSALQAMVDAFSPLVHLERASGNSIAGKLRAAALVDDLASPLWIEPGAPLVPVLRINDRLGRAAGDQVTALPLTIVSVVQREGGSVVCEIHSAARHRLGARASLRLSRYGLAVRTPPRDMRITLQAVGSEAALADYELVEKSADGQVRELARTDSLGTAMITASDRPWRLLFVRQGEHLLARLPVIRGYEPEIVVPLVSNDVRLRSEGFVAALTQEVVDTVARRQILAARLQQRIAAGDFDAAQGTLDELQRLAGRREFEERLQAARTRFTGTSARGQQHIDELFRETRESIARYLDPQEIRRLETQLAQARNKR